jgi:hypothetical protein
MSTTEWMLQPPPGLFQLQFHNRAADYVYWAACAEMIIKWQNPGAWFSYPGFELNLNTYGRNTGEYFGMVLEQYGFRRENDGGYGTWSVALMASYLCWRGPLLARGRFKDVLASDEVHEIVVFGLKNGLVHYIDPLDATRKALGITLFQQRLWRSYFAVLTHTSNHRQDVPDQVSQKRHEGTEGGH